MTKHFVSTNIHAEEDRQYNKDVAKLKAKGIMPPDIGFPNWFKAKRSDRI